MGRKILMVGLGGTGCKAVARVRERVIQERREAADRMHFSDIQFVGFDTDQSGISSYGTLPMVWTARSASVMDLLQERDEWTEWFPAENNYLLARNGLRGAGQLRVLSRLLLEDTLKRENSIDDPMAALHSAFDHLQLQDGDRNPPEVVVMIISSFAGGTGSGIFIQMALYLRKQLMERLHCNTALIRGLFALPDIYTRSLHNDQEIESVYANAYASLKELCAINRLFSGNDRLVKNIHMHYDDLFDSELDKDDKGRLPITKVPYNSIFFVDDVNINGQRLPDIDAYENMIQEIAYMQIYSPMADNMLSQEDNLIRSTILSRGQKIFASAGCSKIVYPHDDIVEYCVKRMMVDSLDSEWLYFDKQYIKQKVEAEKRKKLDRSVQVPNISHFFVNLVDQVINNITPQFAYLYDDIMITPNNDDSGIDQTPIKKQDLFMSALKEHVKAQIDGKSARNEAIKAAAQKADIENFGKKKEDLVKNISGAERKLQQYLDTVEEQLPAICGAMVYDILPDSMASSADIQPFSLSSLLKNSDGSAIHPLAARYLLYALQQLMDDGQNAAIAAMKKDIQKIRKHLSRDWNEKKEGRQTAAQSVPTFHRRSYVEAYAEAREKCYRSITNYAENKLLSEVLRFCAGRISELVRQFELFFTCLQDVMTDQKREADRLETMHDGTSGTMAFVQASSQNKRQAYHLVAMMGRNNMPNLYGSIITELYDSTLRTEQQRLDIAFADKDTQKAMEDQLSQDMGKHIRALFDKEVADTFRNIILSDTSDAVNINIIRAMEKECRDQMRVGLYMDTDEPRKVLLDKVRAYSIPRLMFERASAGNNSKIFWGISEESAKAVHGGIKAYFGGTEEVVQSSRYSDYEISCYQAVYELALMDVTKFRDSGRSKGIYFINYESLRQKMEEAGGEQREDALTPHTDKRWIEELPMISDERNEEECMDSARVFWLGLLFERIKAVSLGGVKKYCVITVENNGSRHSDDLLLNGNLIAPFDYISVFKALNQNMSRVKNLKEVLDEDFKSCKKIKETTESTLEKSKNLLVVALIDSTGRKSTNPLTILGRMIRDGLTEEPALYESLYNALFDILAQLQAAPSAQKALKHLIYKYSIYCKYVRAWKDYAPEWLDEWKSPHDLEMGSAPETGETEEV